MSAALSVSRANNRPSKNLKLTAQLTQTAKSDGPPSKMQPTATPEQMRIAQMISDPSSTDDEELRRKIEQIKELTNRSSDEVQIALHDCENDTEQAVNYLLEREPDQGVWRETGKKKKRATPTLKTETVSNNIDEKTEKREKSPDRDPKDKPDFSSRRGRRNDSRPPRLSRGRGRERVDKEDGENEKDDSLFGRERNFERGRGRGRGGPRRTKGGSNRFNRGGQQNSTPRFDSGPQIDTWTNETAENAEKGNSGCGDTGFSEDWNEDCWSGSVGILTETQVFTAKAASDGKVFASPTEPSGPGPMNDTTNTLGTRLDLGALLQKPQLGQSPETSFSISQYNQQATESIKNSIGIGSASRPMLSEQLSTHQSSQSVSQFGSFNHTMAPSSTVNMPQTSQPVVAQPPQQQPVSMPQRPKPQRTKLPPPSKIPASAVEMPGKMVTSLDVQFGNLEFGADTSPFSFGGGNDSAVSNTYTDSSRYGDTSIRTDTVTNGSPPMSNHVTSQVNQSGESVISTSLRTSGPPNKSQMAAMVQTSPRPSAYPTSTYNMPPNKDIASLNQVTKINPSDPIPFPGAPGERKDSPLMGQRTSQGTSCLNQGSLSTTKPETEALSSFAQSQSTYQSSNYQSRPQNVLPSSSPYPHVSATPTVSSSYAAQFSVSTNQFQTSQNQYQSNPNQYQTNKKTFQNYSSGSSSFQNQPGFNSNAANPSSLYQTNAPTSTFQTQTAQNLYHQGTSAPSSFQTQSNSAFHNRDSQSGLTFHTTVTQSSSPFGRDSQSSSTFSRDVQNSVSFRDGSFQRDGQSSAFQRDSTQNSSFPRDSQAAYQRDGQSSGPTFARGDNQSSFPRESQPSAYPRESVGSYTRDSQSSTFSREGQTFQREAAAAAGNYQRDAQAASVYPRDSQAAGSYSRESQSSSTFPRENQSSSTFPRENQSSSTFPRENQSSSTFPRENQSSSTFPTENQSSSTFPTENQSSSTFPTENQSSSTFPRENQSSSTFPRENQSSSTFPRENQSSSTFPRENQSSSTFPRENQSSSTFPRENQSSSTFPRENQSTTSYSRDTQSATYPRDSQTKTSYTRESQNTAPYPRESQSVTSFQRDGTGASSYQRDGAAATYQRDGQTSSYQRDSQSSGTYPRDSQISSTFTRDAQSAAGYSLDNQASFQRDGSSFQRDCQSSTGYQRDGQSSTATSYQRDGQNSTGYQRDGQNPSTFSTRDGQTAPNFQRDTQSASAFQRDSQTAVSFSRDSQSSLTTPNTQSQTAYSTQSYNSSGHQSNLQTSQLNANKLGDTLSKMSVKENSLETATSQFDGTTSTSTTSLTSLTGLTTCASTTTLASVTAAMVTATVSTTTISSTSTKSSTLPVNTTKAPPNLTPGIPPLLGHQYIMGQGTMPPFYPLYSYEDLQLLQQRLPLQNNYYDMAGFPGVPTTMTGRDQNSLANVQYSATDNKMTRVDAQSPIPTSQQQSSQSAHQPPYINLNYGYYYPTLVPGGGFQYPAMFPMPPVTNTAHAGTTQNSQYQKTYASHGYTSGKGYDDITQTPDFTKAAYGMQQAQAKVSGSVSVTAVAGTSDIAAYGKSHAQAFDKQGYAGTPPPFSLPLATGMQTGHMGAPTTPYAAPFVPVMTHQPQPHSQMMHLLQDATGGSARGSHTQQTASQPKTAGSKPYTTAYWSGN